LVGNVEGHRVGAVVLDVCREIVCCVSDCRWPRGASTGLAVDEADFRVEHPVGARGTEVERRALGAEAAEVGRVVRVAADGRYLGVFGLD